MALDHCLTKPKSILMPERSSNRKDVHHSGTLIAFRGLEVHPRFCLSAPKL